MTVRLYLRPQHLRRLREGAEAAWPHEACGLLESDGAGRIRRVHWLRNVHAEPWHRYTIDPETYLRLEHAARARGHILAGVWHSHPHGDPAPSSRDVASAWPGWRYIIVGVDSGGMTALRGWWIGDDGTVATVSLVVRG